MRSKFESINEKVYIATIGKDAVKLSKENEVGLELDHFCMAENMDEPNWSSTNRQVFRDLGESEAKRIIFHAPFNELFPAAIDPKAKALAKARYDQAHLIAKTYGCCRLVVHSGYIPFVYFKSYHEEKSIEFWTDFMKDKPETMMLVIENVLEDEPEMMRKMIEGIYQREKELGGRHQYGICLDVGHAAVASKVSVLEWIETLGPYLTHCHLHCNNGKHDYHDVFDCENAAFDMEAVFEALAEKASPDLTYTIEALDPAPCIEWMRRKGLLD